jgi:hypothetical protein
MTRFLAAILLRTLRHIVTMLIVMSASAYMSGSRGAELAAEGRDVSVRGCLAVGLLGPPQIPPSAETGKLIARKDQ